MSILTDGEEVELDADDWNDLEDGAKVEADLVPSLIPKQPKPKEEKDE